MPIEYINSVKIGRGFLPIYKQAVSLSQTYLIVTIGKKFNGKVIRDILKCTQ